MPYIKSYMTTYLYSYSVNKNNKKTIIFMSITWLSKCIFNFMCYIKLGVYFSCIVLKICYINKAHLIVKSQDILQNSFVLVFHLMEKRNSIIIASKNILSSFRSGETIGTQIENCL